MERQRDCADFFLVYSCLFFILVYYLLLAFWLFSVGDGVVVWLWIPGVARPSDVARRRNPMLDHLDVVTSSFSPLLIGQDVRT